MNWKTSFTLLTDFIIFFAGVVAVAVAVAHVVQELLPLSVLLPALVSISISVSMAFQKPLTETCGFYEFCCILFSSFIFIFCYFNFSSDVRFYFFFLTEILLHSS